VLVALVEWHALRAAPLDLQLEPATRDELVRADREFDLAAVGARLRSLDGAGGLRSSEPALERARESCAGQVRRERSLRAPSDDAPLNDEHLQRMECEFDRLLNDVRDRTVLADRRRAAGRRLLWMGILPPIGLWLAGKGIAFNRTRGRRTLPDAA
jgi:hypothetical protein